MGIVLSAGLGQNTARQPETVFEDDIGRETRGIYQE